MIHPVYQPVFQVECKVCDATPTVAIQRPKGILECTKLCGRCFFHDRSMLDYDLWNLQPDSTE